MLRQPRLVLLAALSAVIGTSRVSAQGDAEVRAELEVQYRALADAHARKDLAAIAALKTADFHAILPDGRVGDAQTMAEYTRQFLELNRPPFTIENTILELTVSENRLVAVAEVSQEVTRTRELAGRLRRVDTSVKQRETWVKTTAGWRLSTVDNVREQKRFVEGKRVDPTKPYDPDAPPYEPVEREQRVAAAPWRPAGIASPQFESHAAFDPWNGDLFFVRSSPAFQGWRILTSHCESAGWSRPVAPPFAGDGVEADPYFASDGRSLYFISTRPIERKPHDDLDIWRVDRDPSGTWTRPERLPEPVNSPAAEWFPRLAPDGWLYFGSDRPGGLGGTDIWRARADGSGVWRVENLGAPVNTAGDEYEPLPAPDDTRLIVMADGGLYETRRTSTGWSARTKLGPEVNVNGSEIGALFSPSGRSMLFSRDLKGDQSGEFFLFREGGDEAWPPQCPRQSISP